MRDWVHGRATLSCALFTLFMKLRVLINQMTFISVLFDPELNVGFIFLMFEVTTYFRILVAIDFFNVTAGELDSTDYVFVIFEECQDLNRVIF